LRGGSFRRVLRTQALRRGGCRAQHSRRPAACGPRRIPLPHPPAPRLGHHPRAGAPGTVKMSKPAGRSAAHCPGWPLQPQRCSASRCAGRACGAPLTPETSASPAGLTARARPQARPETRAANLPVVDVTVYRPSMTLAISIADTVRQPRSDSGLAHRCRQHSALGSGSRRHGTQRPTSTHAGPNEAYTW
jgi:hypothetical protein